MAVKFVRIKGRIVPIKEKDTRAKGYAQLAAGAGISVASGVHAGKILRKATGAFSHSAKVRGASKLVMGKKSTTYLKLIKEAATYKTLGKSLTKKSSAALFIGTTVGGVLGSIGANNILKKGHSDERALKVEAIGVGIGTIGLLPFGKAAKLSKLGRFIGKKTSVKDAFNAYKASGMRKTSDTINKFSKTAYKGFKAKKGNVYNAKQVDMFGEKKLDIKRWFK
jgi:hypothetical protein